MYYFWRTTETRNEVTTGAKERNKMIAVELKPTKL